MRRILGALCVALVLTSGACAYDPRLTGPLTAAAEAQSSKVFAADGTLITTLHATENRETVTLDKMARSLRDAVVAIEDRRFWQHAGIDLKAVLRAVRTNTEHGGVVQGGSTITQQFVKNALLDPERTLHRKLREASLAYQLEKRSTKAQILEGYLNTIYFGNGAYGAQAAASVYFGTTADRLSLDQSALLAAMIRNPTEYDPYRRPAQATARRNLVLDQLAAQGYVPRATAAEAATHPLGVTAHPAIARYPAAYFVEETKRAILDNPAFGKTEADRQAALYTGGLRIYTTVDLGMQAQAEDAVAKVLSKPDTDPDAAVVTVEPKTGAVRALVGGHDFFGAGAHAKFDLATQGGRPAGSSFKPLVLAAALQAGVPLARTYAAPSQISLPLPAPQQPWDVRNYEDESGGQMNLLEATVHSINTVYAQLILDIGADRAVGMARRLGVRSPLEAVPSAVLGTNDVTPLDLATAYATFANHGLRVDPVFVTKVTKADGTILYEHHASAQRAVASRIADQVTDVLQQVVSRGTGVKAAIGRPMAGKTGTGEEYRDAWFVGYTPDLVSSVWVGFSQGQISMVPPTTRIQVTGGSWPAQIWQLYMSAALSEQPATSFTSASTDGGSSAPAGPPVAVPNVVGRPFPAATTAVEEAGLTAVRHDVPNGDYPPGFVTGVHPDPGTMAPTGSAITLDVAAGAGNIVVVPDVLGLDPDAAKAALIAAGLQCEVVVEPEPASPGAAGRAGQVWRQSLLVGTRRQAGDTVTVSVNPAPPPPTTTTSTTVPPPTTTSTAPSRPATTTTSTSTTRPPTTTTTTAA